VLIFLKLYLYALWAVSVAGMIGVLGKWFAPNHWLFKSNAKPTR